MNNINFESLSPFVSSILKDFIKYLGINGQIAIDNDVVDDFINEYTKQWNNNKLQSKEYFNTMIIYDIMKEMMNNDV